jgi:carboxymethylenebutenolidase
MGDMTTIGSVSGYLARPVGSGPWPALFVIQEWWGLDQQTRNIADRFAAEGYLAFAPDLYEGELADMGDSGRAMTLVQKYGPAAPAKLAQAYDVLRGRPDVSGKLGSVGFCFGGRMSLSLGVSRPVDAVCTFYGGGMQQVFDQLGQLRAPVLGLFGDADQSIPVGTVEEFDQILTQLKIPHEIKIYPESGHAFFRDLDPTVYRPEASADAWERVKKFLKANLN